MVIVATPPAAPADPARRPSADRACIPSSATALRPIPPASRLRRSSPTLAGLPCNAASAAVSRSGTGAMPPAVRRTNWNVPSLITARAQIFDQRPFGMGAADRALVERALALQRRQQARCSRSSRPAAARCRRAVGAVAEQVADRQRTPPVGGDLRFIGEQRRGHRRGMRRHAGAEIEGDVIEMIARSRRTIGRRPSSGRRYADCGNTSSANAARDCRRAWRDDGSAASPDPARMPQCPDRPRRGARRRRWRRCW